MSKEPNNRPASMDVSRGYPSVLTSSGAVAPIPIISSQPETHLVRKAGTYLFG